MTRCYPHYLQEGQGCPLLPYRRDWSAEWTNAPMRRQGLVLAVSVLCALVFTGHREAQAASGKTGVFVHETGAQGNRVFVYELTERQKLRPVPGSPFVAGPAG